MDGATEDFVKISSPHGRRLILATASAFFIPELFCHDLIHYKKVLAIERIKEILEMNNFHTCWSN